MGVSSLWCFAAATCVVAASFTGCGGDDDGGVDSGGAGSDASSAACLAASALEIGHCVDTANDAPCLDFASPTRQFRPLAPTEVVQPIIGLQGLNMFVFAVRAAGIVPGTAPNLPTVEIAVFNGDEEVGAYDAQPEFYRDTTDTSLMVAPQLFTVVFLADTFEGASLRVTGQVRDLADVQFCDEQTFVVGELIDGAGFP